MGKVLLFNPRSAVAKQSIPNSILNIAASIEGHFEWTIVDGNCETDPYASIRKHLLTGEYRYLGMSVMPGHKPNKLFLSPKRSRKNFRT